MVEMEVTGVARLPSGSDVAILHERQGERTLGIGIGATAAAAIGVHLAGLQLPRPGTYVLTLHVIAQMGASVLRAVLDEDRAAEPAAFLDLRTRRGVLEFPCAAEDALALAAEAEAPVLVHNRFFDGESEGGEPDPHPAGNGEDPPA